jgi:hypothetical protein
VIRWALVPLGAQALAMLVDELHYHRRRGLPRWERIGHPLDTLTLLACYAVAIFSSPSPGALGAYAALGVFSCLFITKDEWVHARLATPGEHWLHSFLFVIHPVVLAAVAWLWIERERTVILVQAALTTTFGLYQAIYWGLAGERPSPAG